jgi:hypothetical protein
MFSSLSDGRLEGGSSKHSNSPVDWAVSWILLMLHCMKVVCLHCCWCGINVIPHTALHVLLWLIVFMLHTQRTILHPQTSLKSLKGIPIPFSIIVSSERAWNHELTVLPNHMLILRQFISWEVDSFFLIGLEIHYFFVALKDLVLCPLQPMTRLYHKLVKSSPWPHS